MTSLCDYERLSLIFKLKDSLPPAVRAPGKNALTCVVLEPHGELF